MGKTTTVQNTAKVIFSRSFEGRTLGLREQLQENKKRILEALKVLRATHVIITYNGSGDSGCVDSVDIYKNKKEIKTKRSITILQGSSQWNQEKKQWIERTEEKSMSLTDALEELAYEWSGLEHPGWENNDGASGECKITVETGEFTLEHTSYYTESETSEYSL